MSIFTLLQINVERFGLSEAFFAYVASKEPDAITIQEFSYGYNSPFKNLSEIEACFMRHGYTLIFEPEWEYIDDTGNIVATYGLAIATKHTVHSSNIYFLSSQQHAKKAQFDSTYDRFQEPLEDIIEQKYREWACREKEPVSILGVTTHKENTPLHIVTTQYIPSHKCSPAPHMDTHSHECVHFLQDHYPTGPLILGADMNIEYPSPSIGIIEKQLNRVPIMKETTLNPRIHPGFQNNIPPEGYMVDHVFSRGIQPILWKIDQVDISDHLPIMVTFEL